MIKRCIVSAAAVFLAISGQVWADEIVVSGAASLTNAFKDIAAVHEKNHEGTRVVLSFAASDVLQRQIVNGAPVDVFASADQVAMDKAVSAGVIKAGTRQDFARNEVVLIVPADNRKAITSVAALAEKDITRVALGNPDSVPVGRYTRGALQESGEWGVVQSKQILGQNVRQVLDYVARGEVDAGFVFATDAAVLDDKVNVVASLKSPVPVLYPVAVVQHGANNAGAADFLKTMFSDEGQQILRKYGFSRP